MSYLVSIAAFLLAIAILIAVHEFERYFVAKRLGFKVLRFSIGFGKPLWTRRGRDADRTEYCVSAIPLGGYVKLLDEREGEVDPQEIHRSFTHRPIRYRIAVLLAGPLMNLLLASALYAVLAMIGIDVVKPVVAQVRLASPAFAAGLERGDAIVMVGERRIEDAEQLQIAMYRELSGDCRIPLTVSRRSASLSITLQPPAERCRELTEPGELFPGLGLGLQGPIAAVTVNRATAGGAGAKAGLLPGDRIVSVDGSRIDNAQEFVDLIRHSADRQIALGIDRGGRSLSLQAQVPGELDHGHRVGKLALELRSGAAHWPEGLTSTLRLGPLAAIGAGIVKTWEMSSFTVEMLWRILTGQVSAKNISGAISIAEYAGMSAMLGITYFLGMLAIVSVSLGVLNLLPIPLLDGGQIVYQAIEAVKGSPLSERAQLAGQQIGIALLVVLMSVALYNDITRHLNLQ